VHGSCRHAAACACPAGAACQVCIKAVRGGGRAQARLLGVFEATRDAREARAGRELVLAVNRSDYMLDEPSGRLLQVPLRPLRPLRLSVPAALAAAVCWRLPRSPLSPSITMSIPTSHNHSGAGLFALFNSCAAICLAPLHHARTSESL